MKDEKLKITYPDGKTIEVEKGTSASELAKNFQNNGQFLALRMNNKIY